MDKKEERVPSKKIHRARSPEARENQLISLAIDQAEELLMSGKAPTSVLVHYLKLGTTTARIEKELLTAQKDLTVAKREAILAEKEMGELYKEAMAVMREYGGLSSSEDEDVQ